MWQLNDDKSKDKKIQELESRLEQVEKKLTHLVTVVREPGKEDRYMDLIGVLPLSWMRQDTYLSAHELRWIGLYTGRQTKAHSALRPTQVCE